jgi:hypothetical protein
MEALGPVIPRSLWWAFWLILAAAAAVLTAARLREVPTVQGPKGPWSAVEHRASGDSVMHTLSFVGEGAIYARNHEIPTVVRVRRGCIEIRDGGACQPFEYFPPDSLIVGTLHFSPVPDSLR